MTLVIGDSVEGRLLALLRFLQDLKLVTWCVSECEALGAEGGKISDMVESKGVVQITAENLLKVCHDGQFIEFDAESRGKEFAVRVIVRDGSTLDVLCWNMTIPDMVLGKHTLLDSELFEWSL